ncbi:glycosyl transferase [Leptospira selangorensis]|uniref:Glycosyl transferase n=1 Tax=Leptospira selangorensis TaxID=2484982 RepID=A0A5F2C085_9LEPT|nr:sugar transferase [Leptospira selangorensis]TGM15568.1 glycosyl transferase [Leptospira selangorensis]TGM18482.1 glycosyl transferase [Leptospira selangorensis]
MKRILEFSLALIALLVFFPILLGIFLLISVFESGPIFFLQERIGLGKKVFRIWKFRTLKDGIPTRIGSFLRNTGLDELPQIWNIVKGDMSIVGPRPLTEQDIHRLGWGVESLDRRWSVRPGITGLSQLYSGRGSKYSLCFDLSYLKRRSFILDFKIVILTLVMNLFGKKRIRNLLWTHLQKRDRGYFWGNWAKHFRKNADRPYPLVQEQVIGFIPQKRLPVAKSLAIFQLGEAGEGRIAKDIDHIHIYGVDRNYREALKLFVKEEGRHARILGDCVRALRGELIQSNWTEKLFHFGRRLLGTRFKLMVLLVAEVIGICFYKKIAEKIPFGSVKNALLHIAEDEEKHLIFHCTFFKIRLKNPITRFLFKFMWRFLSFAACVSVLMDHRKTFKALEIPIKECYLQFKNISRNTERKILQTFFV